MTDAEELKQKADKLVKIADDFHPVLLQVTQMIDEMQQIAVSLGDGAPPVVNLLGVAIDNLGSAKHHVGQVADVIEQWAERL